MPQEHYVLRCFSCGAFQVHIVKKAKKWECKICGAKQSVKRNYGRGSGKDCRNQVLRLNELRLIKDCDSNAKDGPVDDDYLTVNEFKEHAKPNKPFTSKWEKYLDEPKSDLDSETDSPVIEVEEKKKKRVKKMCNYVSDNNEKSHRDSDTIKEASPVTSHLFSPVDKLKNFDHCSTKKKGGENCPSNAKNKLNVNKYAKYIEDDEDNKSKLMGNNKYLSVFDSDPNDLDNILCLE